MSDHEAIHAHPSELGPPFIQFVLQDPGGGRQQVALWAPTSPWEGSTFRGWLLVEGHPEFDPPRRVLGEGPWQPVWVALEAVGRHVSDSARALVTAPGPTDEAPGTEHEPLYQERASLDPPLVAFTLRDPTGRDHPVAVWAPPTTAHEAGRIYRGWLQIGGHPLYDRPRRVLGEGPWQPVSLAFKIVDDFAAERALTRVG